MWDGWFESSDEPFVPFPVNTPTNSDADADATALPGGDDMFRSLRRNQYWTLTDRPGLDLMALGSNVLRTIPQVCVAHFGAVTHQCEGPRCVQRTAMRLVTYQIWGRAYSAQTQS